MAIISEDDARLRRQTRIVRSDIIENNPNWTPFFVEDYEQRSQSVDELEVTVENNSKAIQENAENIATNAANISVNASNIATNSANISTNTGNIATNTSNITSVTNNFNTHNSSNSQHGVTGDNVGTGDFAQAATGGVVFEAANVADAVDSTVEVTSPNAPVAAATYSQADTQTTVDLVNEMKGDMNQLVTDLNNSITQLNALLAAMQNANQMAP